MADGGAIAAIVIVLFIVIVFGLWLASISMYVVHQAEGIVIERLGKFHRVLNSGLNWVVPFLDRPRAFTWRKTAIAPDGHIVDELTSSIRIDLRESVFNFLQQEVYTQDTVLVDVNALMYYRIHDIKRALYEVDDLQSALSNTAQTQLKEIFGSMSFSEALESQAKINEHLVREFSRLFFAWGIHVERMELLDLSPKGDTALNMKRQMVAERDRRADFIRSEGNKAAMRLKADGVKTVSVNMGIAAQEATKKQSEGEAGARIELVRAESLSLDKVGQTITSDGGRQSDYMISQRYMDLFNQMLDAGKGDGERRQIYIPYDIKHLDGSIAGLSRVFGRHAEHRPPISSTFYKSAEDDDLLSTGTGASGAGAGAGADSGAGVGDGARKRSEKDGAAYPELD